MSDSAPIRPRHVAIIMDGNGRWARERGLPRLKGHEEGAESVLSALRSCRELGIPFLTLYAFSSENWTRPRDEVTGLMQLLRFMLKSREKDLHKERVRLRVIGRMEDLPSDLRANLERVMRDTEGYTEHTLVLALSYGSRAEIADAARQIAREAAAGTLAPESVTEDTVARHLYAPDIPDPDLLIRTSGEIRLSNFLLWQLSYAEFYFTPVYWPAFREAEFRAAVEEFSRRQRRFGGVAPPSTPPKSGARPC
ncbi:MAG: di-trans,poly-cis-decaprenylcistransferase [Kiritimatiellae bacterium]|nr:di-trans,poly-cis-decaprenylcistransferase [Kiritimatiellia bacterium]